MLRVKEEERVMKEYYMKLLFVRHGETDWNAQGKIQGSRDIPLNDKGIEQATELARTIENEYPQVRRVFSSTQQRARQTARVVADTPRRLEASPTKSCWTASIWRSVPYATPMTRIW